MINKPANISQVWGSNAPVANIINPNAVIPNKIELGWLKEIPPLQWFNWIQNSSGNKCAYLNTVGVPDWSNDVIYSVGSWTRGSDGQVYKSFIDNNIDNNPVFSGVAWGNPAGGNVGDFLISYRGLPDLTNRGYLLQNGQAVSRSTYAGLFSLIGTQFGPGDGSTTFNLFNDLENVGVSYVKAL